MKIGRNDACPCGSNKKYKKCCMLTQKTKREIGVLKKVYSSPDDFAVRFLFQMCQIRDCTYKREEIKEYDKMYQPIFQNLLEAKFAKELCEKLINEHNKDILEKKDGKYHGSQIDIEKPIDDYLNLYFKDFFIRGEMAINSIKRFCKFIGYDIGFMFEEKDEKKYKKGLRRFIFKEDDNRFETLSNMIKHNKIAWYIKFNEIRNRIEHEGFSLPALSYGLDINNVVTIKYPKFGEQTFEQIISICWNNLTNLCEEIIVYLSSLKLEDDLIMVQIEEKDRDKNMPIKYAVRHKDFPSAHFSCG